MHDHKEPPRLASSAPARRLPRRLSRREFLGLGVAGVFLLAGCNPRGGQQGGQQGDQPEVPPPTRIVILDVSNSTAGSRNDYYEESKTATREFANQFGTLYVIAAAGNPLQDSKPKTYEFSTKEMGNHKTLDLNRQADKATNEVWDLLDPEKSLVEHRESTALIRSFVLADPLADRPEGKLDIVVVSDGQENKDLYLEDLESDDTIAAALDRLEKDDLLPKNLSGVPVKWVLQGYAPGSTDSVPDPNKLKRFWELWAKRVGAELTWEKPRPVES